MDTNTTNQANETRDTQGAFDIRRLSVEQLGQLGLTQLAYVKPIVVDGAPGFAIHAADGTPMGVAPDRNVAVAAIMQHEMMPASVH